MGGRFKPGYISIVYGLWTVGDSDHGDYQNACNINNYANACDQTIKPACMKVCSLELETVYRTRRFFGKKLFFASW